MTVGNFSEVLGTDGFDSLTGSNLDIIYGLEERDSLVAGAGENLNEQSVTVLVGGSGRNIYSIRENSVAVIFENADNDDNTLFTTVLASGIDINDDSFVIAEIDNRHLYFGNTNSSQYAILIDWQQPANIIENFDFVGENISFDTFVSIYQDLDGYLGNLTWSQLIARGNIELENFGIELTAINDNINTIIERSQDLEGIENEDRIGNFSELLGTDGFDSISGADLQIVYALEGNDVLNSFPNFNGGSLPDGGETTILVGGSDNNSYQVRNNSTAIVIENGDLDDNILWTTIGSGNPAGIGFAKETSFFTEIDNRHLYLGDTNSNQYVILVDWQQPENQIESFDLVDGRISYDDFVTSFRNSDGYRGNITWDELPPQIDLERLGLEATSIENTFERIKTRAAELENLDRVLPTIELFRFRNTNFTTGTYLFVGEAEKNSIESTEDFSNSFTLEGRNAEGIVNPAFTASLEPGEDLLPFFRLSSRDNPGTFLFVSTEEYNTIFAEDSEQRDRWDKQGLNTIGEDIPEFYLSGSSSVTRTEFHRFQNRENGTFLFAGETETKAINNDPNLASIFIDQGVAFYSL